MSQETQSKKWTDRWCVCAMIYTESAKQDVGMTRQVGAASRDEVYRHEAMRPVPHIPRLLNHLLHSLTLGIESTDPPECLAQPRRQRGGHPKGEGTHCFDRNQRLQSPILPPS